MMILSDTELFCKKLKTKDEPVGDRFILDSHML